MNRGVFWLPGVESSTGTMSTLEGQRDEPDDDDDLVMDDAGEPLDDDDDEEEDEDEEEEEEEDEDDDDVPELEEANEEEEEEEEENGSRDDGTGEMIARLCQLTGLPWEEAQLFLEMSDWDLSRAAEIFYADAHQQQHHQSDKGPPVQPQAQRSRIPGAVGRALGGAWSVVRRTLSTAPAATGREAARKFAENYELTYGRRGRSPTFCVESYKAAARFAQSRSKALLVFLHCPLHQDADDFCMNVLNAPDVARYLAAHFVVWGADVSSADGRVLMDALRVSRLPFLGVLVCRNGEELVDRVQGIVDPRMVLSRLSRASRAYRRRVAAVRRLDATRQQDRQLRREQDAEFQASLEADRKKEQLHRERQEEAARQEAELKLAADKALQEAAELEQRKAQALADARRRLGDEPRGPPQKSARVRVQLPNGTKVDRRFPLDATIDHLRDFVNLYIHDNHLDLDKFQFATNYPRRIFYDLPSDDLASQAPDAGLPISELNGKVVYVQDLDA